VHFGYVEVILKSRTEFLRTRGLDHLGQGLGDVLLRIVQFSQLVNQEFFKGVDLHTCLLAEFDTALPV
jgi:hypothetical protein